MATASVQNSPILKELASSDAEKRSEAMEKFRIYLRGHSRFTEIDLLKLWKGLFYCMWMSDQPSAQQQLARDLASFVHALSEENVLPFLDTFWKTMAREWNGIDALRMDKYLFLVRQILAASFGYLSRSSWSNDISVTRYTDMLSQTPLNATDPRIPNGLRFHLLDIYVDELDKIDNGRSGQMPLDTLLQPIRNLEERSPVKAVRKRAQETLKDERLQDWNAPTDQEEDVDTGDGAGTQENDEEEWGGVDD